MRRLSADRLESVEKSLLLGQVTASAGKQPAAAPDPAEVLRAQRQQIFDAAREQGFAEGKRDAESEVARQVEAIAGRLRQEHEVALGRLRSERERLENLASSLRNAIIEHAAMAEQDSVEVALAAVVHLLGEKSADRSLMTDLCRRVVHDYGHPPATLRISEADLPLVDGIKFGIPMEVDRRLAPGQCVVDTARGQFESGLDVRLQALCKSLLATVADHRRTS